MKIAFTPAFLRQLKKLSSPLLEEIYEKTELQKSEENHKRLKVHKLHGSLSDCYSFSVNYKIRIVFERLNKDEVVFHAVGDHFIYQ